MSILVWALAVLAISVIIIYLLGGWVMFNSAVKWEASEWISKPFMKGIDIVIELILLLFLLVILRVAEVVLPEQLLEKITYDQKRKLN